MADLYVYFYELGMRLLKPGGRLSFVVTNKWMKAGYGEPLRRFFSEETWIESVVDFGHAKQIFEDADVFPSIIVARKPTKAPKPVTAQLCSIPRAQLRVDDLSAQIENEGSAIALSQLGSQSWQLEPLAISELMAKIQNRGVPMSEFAGAKPLFGIKTGLNEAFLMETPMRDALVKADPKCAAIIRPYLRGQDIKRWNPTWQGVWIVLLKSSSNADWPWSKPADSGAERAEGSFRDTYPSLYAHFKKHEERLRARSDKGTYWWELRSCGYYHVFERPKIMWQDLGYHSSFCLCLLTAVSK